MQETRFPTAAEREKRARLLEMLDEGWVLIEVDPSRPGVELPPHLREERAVGLNIGHGIRASVFEVGPLAIRADLSFQGQRYLCVLPWPSVFAMTRLSDKARLVFPADVPAPREAPEKPEPDPGDGAGGPNGGGRPRLRLVK